MNEILSMYILTDSNVADLQRYHKTPYYADPDRVAGWEPGNILVIQTINSVDLFDPAFGLRAQHSWLVTREQFDARFVMVSDGNETPDFALITRK